MSFWDDLVEPFFGNGSNPGLLGTGQFKTDPTKFALPGFDQQTAQAQGQIASANAQVDPTQQAAARGQQSQLAQMPV